MITQKERFEELCRLDGTSNHDVERKSLFYIIAGNLDSREHLTSVSLIITNTGDVVNYFFNI